MLMGREHVRLAHLGLPESGAFTFGTWAVYPQKVSLMVFAGLLAAGLAVVALMVRWILQGAHPAGKGEGNTPRQPILAEHEPSGADAGHH
jgi:hypothetical protein